jgi:uncharacterized protein HemX
MRRHLLFWLVMLAVGLAALAASLSLSAYSHAQRRLARLETELLEVSATLEETRKQLEESRGLTAQLEQKLAGVTVERDVLIRRRSEADRQIASLQQQITRLRETRPASTRGPVERR